MSLPSRCWCGEEGLDPFSPDYLVCRQCGSLVAVEMGGKEITRVRDDTRDFYGRSYWFDYQEQELGLPSIVARARQDLPERCLYWLRTILAYRQPPARVLELGSGHGGFVLLLRRAGYDATGLELSPWVVDFARRTFGVPMLQGPLEDQSFPPASFDVVVMMDVLEHLPDPVGTLRVAVERLGEDGPLVVQTPCVPPEVSFEDMVAARHPFLPMLLERGHLYLFTRDGLRRLFERVGLGHAAFEPPIFAPYDMFAVGSRRPLTVCPGDAIARALSASPDGRLVQALLDLDDRLRGLAARHEAAEADRAARLEVITAQGERLAASEADRAARLEVITAQGERLAASEADRAARLEVITAQAERLAAESADRAMRLDLSQELARRLDAVRDELSASLVLRGRVARVLGRWLGWHATAAPATIIRPSPTPAPTAVPAAGGSTAPGGPGPAPAVTVYANLDEYARAVDVFNRTRPDMDRARAYHHQMLDVLDDTVGLGGKAVLDLGASPHGYGLQGSLARGAAAYTGVTLGVCPPVEVHHAGGIGRLIASDLESLDLASASVDVAVSLSTFERITNGAGVLREVHRVLRPGGTLFVHVQPVWTSSVGHHVQHLPEARLIPAWAHLFWTPEAMRRALAGCWPATASTRVDDLVKAVYESAEINRLDVVRLRALFASSPLRVEAMTPIRDSEAEDKPRLAACLAGLLGYSADDLMTLGYSILLRKA